MGKTFNLAILPWVYIAHHNSEGHWEEEYIEKPHLTPQEEEDLGPAEREEYYRRRNSFPELPFVGYTGQYGLGCFEGLKALPWKDGRLMLFRPDMNAKRFARSMRGLKMPAFPEESFVRAAVEMTRRNQELGFAPTFDPSWERDTFQSAHSIYLRPFAHSEAAIGLGLSVHPYAVMVSTQVGAYYQPDNTKASTTSMVRSTPGGTGWIKCNANYTISTLAKEEVKKSGFMDAIFLDGVEHRYIEEGSACNIFFRMKDGSLVTPELGDTILDGITRRSVMTLASDSGVEVVERKISIDEALSEAKECFVTGTAAGITSIESITHGKKTAAFHKSGGMGELAAELLHQLKGIQYGTVEDRYGWMVPVK